LVDRYAIHKSPSQRNDRLDRQAVRQIKNYLYDRHCQDPTLDELSGVAELMYDMAIEIQKHYSKQDGIFSYI
jgi:hypothetical protein